MKQNVHNYVQYVIVNNTHDNQSIKGGGNNNIFFKYIHIRLKIILKLI